MRELSSFNTNMNKSDTNKVQLTLSKTLWAYLIGTMAYTLPRSGYINLD